MYCSSKTAASELLSKTKLPNNFAAFLFCCSIGRDKEMLCLSFISHFA